MKKFFSRFTVVAAVIFLLPLFMNAQSKKPNVIIIYVDDLGYGDLGVTGAKGVKTPNLDRMAANGLLFTDGHCHASTCTPSRYSLLTGNYAFRNKAAILPGDAPALITEGTPTIASTLKRAGYHTAVIGKWHLGLGTGNINWNGYINMGPKEIGFDYSFLIPATGDRVPTVYTENQRVVNLDPKDPIQVSYEKKIGNRPTGTENPELLKMKADLQHSNTIVNGVSRIGFMGGGESALWKDEDFSLVFTQKAKEYITANKNNPFFLYFAFQDIHVPRVPHPDFAGKSSMGPRGDAIVQMDHYTGELIKTLDSLGIAENTLVIFSSDNGPVLDDGYDDKAVEMLGEHKPAGPFRGGKYSAFEAGTRVPTIAYWPSKIKPGVSDALFTQVDIYHSVSKLAGIKLNHNEALDSFDALPVLLGKDKKGRKYIIEEAFTLALRVGDWKYIHPVSMSTPQWLDHKKVESALSKQVQLYNLKADPAEKNNIAAKHPKKVIKMQALLEEIKQGNTRKAQTVQ
ncbi:sulfatase family protein [Pedobacter puniceum]|uniref:Sulfatase-like hydrolase/transferase n=1 Tax=Pedobacter puniceum TaxID=2666136 RepID=A0A7K0FM12_9SPHI|nr:arylsulfatase [Pedobacter puniceum]MRX46998.1 sulfatase-like hydrolase/transferase [Pedobacter puniceum]